MGRSLIRAASCESQECLLNAANQKAVGKKSPVLCSEILHNTRHTESRYMSSEAKPRPHTSLSMKPYRWGVIGYGGMVAFHFTIFTGLCVTNRQRRVFKTSYTDSGYHWHPAFSPCFRRWQLGLQSVPVVTVFMCSRYVSSLQLSTCSTYADTKVR